MFVGSNRWVSVDLFETWCVDNYIVSFLLHAAAGAEQMKYCSVTKTVDTLAGSYDCTWESGLSCLLCFLFLFSPLLSCCIWVVPFSTLSNTISLLVDQKKVRNLKNSGVVCLGEWGGGSPVQNCHVPSYAMLFWLPRGSWRSSFYLSDTFNLSGWHKYFSVPGGTMRDSFLVNGVAFKKTFSYAGFEQQPKKFVNPKILLLNVELELKSEKENAEIRLSDPSQYQSIVDAEWNIIYDKLDKCVKSGAKIVLSRLAIGDLATQYFADRDIFCAGRVTEEDLQRVAAATSGTVQTSVNNIIDEVLGSCEVFEERQVGNERFNIFSGCPSGQTATIVLRGGADQFIEEAERSLHDAIMIVRRALKNSTVVAGGGAIDMEISRYLRQHARTIAGKSQLFINAYAKALEVIPRQLCDNAGFDATDVLNKLRQKHALQSGEGALYGVDINTGGIADSFANFVWEPAVVKINAINAATEAACLVLSVDETVKNPKSESAQGDAAASAMGGRGRGGAAFRGRGRGMRRR
ncbi:TCP-1/cpn60 chaperonin family protein [Actinidia rufa]|uniref:CCT-eta n=1 Tax=Actinidia rufa TaxID=165716 RepID=A0A7J0GQJ1_9ERIC|nr:TCP-1/cpn60 chaperonin family protein [Actinidia rufa]